MALFSLAFALVTPLTLETALQRDIKAGESHEFEIAVQAGEYLQVDIEQHGVDVAAEVTGPAGETILWTDSHGGENGPEPVAFVAESSGVHRLVLKAGQRPWPPSQYELRVSVLGPPEPVHLTRAAAVRAGADALRLFRSGGQAKADEILQLLDRQLKGWEELREPYLQLWAESQIGWIKANFQDRYQEAYDHYVRAREIAEAIGNDYSQAYMSLNSGAAAFKLGRLEEALAGLQRALMLDRAAGRRPREGVDASAYGGILVAAGRPQEALDHLREALAIFEQHPHPTIAGHARVFIGDAYVSLGEYDLAVASYELAAEGLARAPTPLAVAHRQIGFAHYKRGDLERARASYERSLEMFGKLGNRAQEASTHVLLGVLQRDLGHLDAARERFAGALAALGAAGDRRWEAVARCELAETLRRDRKLVEAREALNAATSVAHEPSLTTVLCLEQTAARITRDEGDLPSARSHAEKAVEAVERLRTSAAGPRWRASTLAAHHEPYELLVDVTMRLHERQPAARHDAAAFQAAERARARTLLELLSEAGADVREGVAPELREEERALRQRLNAQGAALEEAQASRSEARIATLQREIEEVAARLAEVEGRIRALSPRYAALTQPRALTAAQIQEVLDDDTRLLEFALGDEQSYLWVVSRAGLQSFRLGRRAPIEQAARRFHDLSSRPPAPGARVAEIEQAAQELSRLVLAPAGSALVGRRLVVVAPDALQYVAFPLLRLPDGKPLIERFELVSAPSASVIATLRGERGRGESRRHVAVFGDPVFEATDPRLAGPTAAAALAARPPGTRGDERESLERALRSFGASGEGAGLRRLPFSGREADAIVKLTTGEQGLKAVGFDASRENATSARLAEYRAVHFATHGLLNGSRPELSGIVLSLFDEQGRPQDGFLRLHDVYNLRLDADLVALSGCQTALGKELRGEGLVGLTRGFMYAGARAVLASLWKVDDEATAELMTRFYRGVLKENRRPAEALHRAQLEMSRSRRWSTPFYWAGFVLQGDWQ